MKKILFIGDIVGQKGRQAVSFHLPALIKKYKTDFVIANGENATHGKGLIEHHYDALIAEGVDCITLGNHYDAKSEIRKYLDGANGLIRPYNLMNEYPGIGTMIFKDRDWSIRVTNLLGQAFMSEEVASPFDSLKKIIETEEQADIHIVDFHAEATGEKYALAHAFAGSISALIGTHTHVQTRDARILSGGTGYLSDVGMTGPYHGILGVKAENIIAKLWHQEKTVFTLDEQKEALFSAVLLQIDETTGHTIDITPIYLVEKL
ncbi:MAG TPA: TIGR00282 family metallophosphoesterase [Firmicutes bacterium]|jgi:hypothetical protein|nr:TIGR00282 family metallophosphoesterase [Bacillota bacterium]HAV19589.1 TIGR00282 family metallophosphoesterase [Bacillota bacterium]